MANQVFHPVIDMPELTGKVIIVTGANAGLGYEMVRQLALKNATVYLVARSKAKATTALEKLRDLGIRVEVPELGIDDSDSELSLKGHVRFLNVDLVDPKDAVRAAKVFLEQESRLDVLINSASLLLMIRNMTSMGIQESMIVNHVSPFAFALTLLPLMKRTAQIPGADVRIVNLSSDIHHFLPKDVRFRNKDDLSRDFKGEWSSDIKRYGASKLANILFTKRLQCRLDAEGGADIVVIALHPGSALTEGTVATLRSLPRGISDLILGIFKLFSKTPEQITQSPLTAAIAPYVRNGPNAKEYRGAYLGSRGQLTKPSDAALDEALALELWNTTVEILKEIDVEIPEV